MLQPAAYFDLSDDFSAELFADINVVWQMITALKEKVAQLTAGTQRIDGSVASGAYISDRPLVIEAGARIEPGAYVHGPAYIGRNAVVRHGAFVREHVILGDGAILGHASEAKNSLLLPNAHAPHFNYVGDSVLGKRVNLGAGTKLSNLGMMSVKDSKTGKRPTIILNHDGEQIDTGLAKFGAILGDDAQTGCNSVLNPGCVLGPRTLVYANCSVRKGIYPANTIIKLRQTIELATRRDT